MAAAIKTVTTPDGRAQIIYRDDHGIVYQFVSNGVSILGVSQFNTIITIPLYPDETMKPSRPQLLKGTLLLGAQIAFDVALGYVLADLILTGFVGSTGTVLGRAQLGGNAPLERFAFGTEDTFDHISIDARILVNGEPSSSTNGIQQAQVTAVLDMWS